MLQMFEKWITCLVLYMFAINGLELFALSMFLVFGGVQTSVLYMFVQTLGYPLPSSFPTSLPSCLPPSIDAHLWYYISPNLAICMDISDTLHGHIWYQIWPCVVQVVSRMGIHSAICSQAHCHR